MLAIIAMPLLVSIVFILKIKIAQHKAEEKLEESFLHTLVLKKAQFEWVKNKREITIDGQLFDIKSYHELNGTFTFLGLYDHEETALVKAFSKGIQKNKKAELQGLFQVLLLVSTIKTNEFLVPGINSIVDHPLILPHISFPFQDIITPPPQLV